MELTEPVAVLVAIVIIGILILIVQQHATIDGNNIEITGATTTATQPTTPIACNQEVDGYRCIGNQLQLCSNNQWKVVRTNFDCETFY